jgi:ubiquinone/menaquinone biosynthesis C-methylase UbiE
MSSYENYTRTSDDYDRTRQAVGIELIKVGLARGSQPLARQVLLDAGCGTGQYSKALLSQVAKIEALDINANMLCHAREKFGQADLTQKISFHESAISTIPLADNAVDSVIINQVLHHLSDSAANDWRAHRAVFAELARVLRPGGAIVINSCSHLQLERGFWFYHLIPSALHQIKERTCDISMITQLLFDAGFEAPENTAAVDIVMQGDAYFNPAGVIDSEWRSGDSIWALATEEDLQSAIKTVEQLTTTASLNTYFETHDQHRPSIGQLTFTSAIRGA